MIKILIILSSVVLASCSQEQEQEQEQEHLNFITVTNKELGMEDRKVFITDLVEMMSKGLPMTMDSNTEWVRFTQGTELKSVVYSLLLTSKEIKNFTATEIQNMGMVQREQLNNGYCSDPQFNFIRTNGISSEYRYFDKDFNYLFSIFSKNLNCEN